jgi:hypothetical protein
VHYINKKILYVSVASAILLSGCFSYFRIESDEYNKITENKNISIQMKTGKEIRMDKIRKEELSDSSIIIYDKYSVGHEFLKNEIEVIRVEKFDYIRSILTPLFIVIAATLLFASTLVTFSPGG